MNTKRIGTLQELLPLARGNKKVVAIAAAEDDTVLKAAQKAYEHGIADFILFGDPEKIRSIAQDEGIDVSSFQIVSAFRPEEAGYMAAQTVQLNDPASGDDFGFPQKGRCVRAQCLDCIIARH